MAARQGITAHISQASEDAKRAVLSRTPTSIKSHSWLSNLNTTCTIKSAPPRTPEVMTLLATRSGWLVKRNEQHVWQRRWCCVVPHTFLYYFEAEPVIDGDESDGYETRENFSGGGIYKASNAGIVVENQEILNAAIRDNEQVVRTEHRRSYYAAFSGYSASHMCVPSDQQALEAPLVRGPTTTSSNLQPTGIIDLECYTNVIRSVRHDYVFELTGDAITNPDLRSFYFQAANVDETDAWTNALLSNRHSALKDERDAYRQVCDSFPLQLQQFHLLLQEAEQKTNEAKNELYTVRCTMEKLRTCIVEVVREILERKCWGAHVNSGSGGNDNVGKNHHDNSSTNSIKSERERQAATLETSRQDTISKLNDMLGSRDSFTHGSVGDRGTMPLVQLLADYVSIIIVSYTDLTVHASSMEHKLTESTSTDKAAVENLQSKVLRMEEEVKLERIQYEERIVRMEEESQASRFLKEDAENHLQTHRMEFVMYQTQAKAKMTELSQHKKILKKEVIELRKKTNEIVSERDAVSHKNDLLMAQIDAERERNIILERYVEKMEKQIEVQQSMMEMISVGGGPSVASRERSDIGRVAGHDAGSVYGGSVQQNRLPPSAGSYGNTRRLNSSTSFSNRMPPSVKEIEVSRNDGPDSIVSPPDSPLAMSPSSHDSFQRSGVALVHEDTLKPYLSNEDETATSPIDLLSSSDVRQGDRSLQKDVDRDNRMEYKAPENESQIEKDDETEDSLAITKNDCKTEDDHIINNKTKPERMDKRDDEAHSAKDSSVDRSVNEINLGRKNNSRLEEASSHSTEPTEPTSTEQQSSVSIAHAHRMARYQRALARKHSGPHSPKRSTKSHDIPSPARTTASTVAATFCVESSQLQTNILLNRNDKLRSGKGTLLMPQDDDDEKSQLSELTEERTQKAIDQTVFDDPLKLRRGPASFNQSSINGNAIVYSNDAHQRGGGTRDDSFRPSTTDFRVNETVEHASLNRSRNALFPPRYIIGSNGVLNNPEDDCNNTHGSNNDGVLNPAILTSQASSATPNKLRPWRGGFDEQMSVSMSSVGSYGNGKLSVAQRARIEADTQTGRGFSLTPPPSLKATDLAKQSVRDVSPASSRGSFFTSLGRNLVEAIDNSAIGVKVSPGGGSSGFQSSSVDDTTEDLLKKNQQLVEETNMTLQQRMHLQRERQIAALKQKGILKNEASLLGGAGGGDLWVAMDSDVLTVN